MLWLALAAILYLNYEAWMRDYPEGVATPQAAPAAVAPAGVPATPAASSLQESIPTPPTGAGGTPGTVAPPSAVPAAADSSLSSPGTTAGSAAPLHVRTDVLDLSISLKGGELERADLLQYPLHKDTPNVPVRLFSDDNPDSEYVLQSGLTAEAGQAAPSHLALWTADAPTYELAAGAKELRVPLTWTDGHGLTVTKTFVFTRGLYYFDLVYEVHNGSDTARRMASYSQFLRHWEHASRSYFDVETYSFKGPAIYDGTKYRRLNVETEDDTKFSDTISNGWLASMQHHFVSAIVPPAGKSYRYQLQVRGHEYLLSATGPLTDIPAGGMGQFHETLFVGPKLQAQLEAAGPGLDRTADYGKLTVLAKPLFLLLKWVHGLIGNWGWSIVIVTALIKLLFYPLSQASGRSMAKMRAVAPRLKQIQDTFKDDREKLGRAMMELYKKEKINPLAGCLPMLVQIPFFISFYWVLLESVEMRQAPFLLWINDLSARDPYFVLPLLMGGAMFAQFKLNPAPPDPMQAKIMQFMPLVMTGMMAWFPSGLVLYWLTNTVLSIAQQWRVNQVVEAETAKRRS
jgi:YidC/Oxa1 family membrane protein insertase